MFIAPLGVSVLLWATYGECFWCGGVIKIEEWKSDGLWHVVVYSGGPEERRINPAKIRNVVVDGKAKDAFTGRLLIDEMRELLNSKEIVEIRFNWKDHVAKALAVHKDVGLYLKNLEEFP